MGLGHYGKAGTENPAEQPRKSAFPLRVSSGPRRLERPDAGRGACRLRRWELALALSLTLTLLHGAAVPRAAAWWGVIFPGLLPGGTADMLAAVETLRRDGAAPMDALRLIGGGGSVELRFFLLDWLASLFA